MLPEKRSISFTFVMKLFVYCLDLRAKQRSSAIEIMESESVSVFVDFVLFTGFFR